ncbi:MULTISPECIES: hypothetical protein [Pseudomonas]|uniref:hypothetical protein n=1 Tax=Pseudomonas nitroreducens TaxID=46680 RepID=UPI001E4B2A52|nr:MULTISPECIES: hypothetical protein [Pseudomonas]MCE4070146.1 hypothetical protein [Pseudomonas nitritireducens]MCE4078751.1 hypothetical protein [Pseudomonas nitroreducens]
MNTQLDELRRLLEEIDSLVGSVEVSGLIRDARACAEIARSRTAKAIKIVDELDTQAAPAPTSCKHVFTDDGLFTVACTECGICIKAEPSHAVMEQARQEAFDAGGDGHGLFLLDSAELDQIVANACAMAVIEHAAAPAQRGAEHD